MRLNRIVLALVAVPACAETLDLRNAVVVPPRDAGVTDRKAVTMLVEEIVRRTQIRLATAASSPSAGVAIVLERSRSGPPEGYSIRTADPRVTVSGNDPRGMLFGVGQLLRSLHMSRQAVSLPAPLNVASAPRMPLRGHQLGYRPKTNSYDGWSLPVWEQYIRDLAVFGTNAIELIPPRSDDDDDSPHFPAPKLETMIGMSQTIADYGLDVWIWYPAMDKDYSDPATVEFALQEWGEVFRRLPRVDAVFVPGGDPGHTRPKVLMALLEKQTENLHRYHPRAQMWVSPQSFSKEWMDEFLAIVKTEPNWLAGVVHGPQVRMTLPRLRSLVPARYPIRNYPDITHSLTAEFPVPDWDLAYALTLGREPINPRPRDEAHIFRLLREYTNGFLTYSEGCNDDVNKIVWSALGWDPGARIEDILRDYSRYFISARMADGFARGLLALEENWRGSLLANSRVEETLATFQQMERAATPQDLLNWRFQQALYRAYYDAYIRRRLLHETEAEKRARDRLADARRIGSMAAMQAAENELDRASPELVAPGVRSRVFALAEALYQSIRMQLGVSLYKGMAGRGTNLDTIDRPLNNRDWWKHEFAQLRKEAGETVRLQRITELLERESPGPGGFYDALGDPMRRPHLVRGPGFAGDPYALESPRTGFRVWPDTPASWWRYAETHFDTPVELRYSGLDPAAPYRVRVVMAGEPSTASHRIAVRLVAAGKFVIYPYMEKPVPIRPLEFDIPAEATAGGELSLRWELEPGAGGNGRGCQIAEVWLMKK